MASRVGFIVALLTLVTVRLSVNAAASAEPRLEKPVLESMHPNAPGPDEGWGFVTHDSEIELLALRSLILNRGFDLTTPLHPMAEEGGIEESRSTFSGYLSVRGDRLIATRPPAFIFLTLPFYLLFGTFGLYVVPFLSLIGTVLAAGSISNSIRLHDDPRPRDTGGSVFGRLSPVTAGALCALAGCPILFYGLAYWNMIFGAFCFTSSLALILSRRARPQPGRMPGIASGLLLGLGASVRPEIILSVLPISIWLTFRFRSQRNGFLYGLAMLGAIQVALNLVLFDQVAGSHIAGNLGAVGAVAEWVGSRFGVLHALWMRSSASDWIEWIALGLTFGCALAAHLEMWRQVSISLLLLSICSVVIFASALGTADPSLAMIGNLGLLASAPFLIVGLLGISIRPKGDSELTELRALVWMLASSALLTSLTCPPNAAIAIHWGPRILLYLQPALAAAGFWVAVHTVHGSPGRWGATALILLLIVSGADQLHGVSRLFAKRSAAGEFKTNLARLGSQPIVTDHWAIPLDLASWYLDRPLWLLESGQAAERVLNRLASSDTDLFISISTPGSPLARCIESLARRRVLHLVDTAAASKGIFYLRESSIRLMRFGGPRGASDRIRCSAQEDRIGSTSDEAQSARLPKE